MRGRHADSPWLDRLGRNYADVCEVVRDFLNRGVTIKTVINGMTFDGQPKDAMQKVAIALGLETETHIRTTDRREIADVMTVLGWRRAARPNSKGITPWLAPTSDFTNFSMAA